MAIEMGGKTGLVEPDEKTVNYLKDRTNREYGILKTDLDAESLDTTDICR